MKKYNEFKPNKNKFINLYPFYWIFFAGVNNIEYIFGLMVYKSRPCAELLKSGVGRTWKGSHYNICQQ